MMLRPVEREDLPQMADIEALCSQTPWGPRMLAEALGLKGAWNVGLEEDGQLLGFGLFYQVLDEWQVMTLCVSPKHRRRGIGRRLMEEAKETAKQQGARKMSLEVRQSNEAALKLYAQVGFSRVGLRKAYYSDREDAILMDCLLKEGT